MISKVKDEVHSCHSLEHVLNQLLAAERRWKQTPWMHSETLILILFCIPLSPTISAFKLYMKTQQRPVSVCAFVHNTIADVRQNQCSQCYGGLICEAFVSPCSNQHDQDVNHICRRSSQTTPSIDFGLAFRRTLNIINTINSIFRCFLSPISRLCDTTFSLESFV